MAEKSPADRMIALFQRAEEEIGRALIKARKSVGESRAALERIKIRMEEEKKIWN